MDLDIDMGYSWLESAQTWFQWFIDIPLLRTMILFICAAGAAYVVVRFFQSISDRAGSSGYRRFTYDGSEYDGAAALPVSADVESGDDDLEYLRDVDY